MNKKAKCNCGAKATTEWLNRNFKEKVAWTLYFCDSCRPYNEDKELYIIDGKNRNYE